MLKVFITRNSKNNFDKITVMHNKEHIDFMGKGSIKLSSNKEMSEEVELFTPINDYFDIALSEEQEKNIYNLYQQAADIIENNDFSNYEKEMVKIEQIVTTLLEQIKPANLMNFFEHSSKYMVIPKDLKKAPGHGYYPEETTFVVNDYVDVVKMTFLIRVTYPIFFGLLFRFESLTGINYANLICGAILHRNEFIRETRGFKRLQGYVNHSFLKSNNNGTIETSSSEHGALIVLYRILFLRLSSAMIPETLPGKSIINAISSEVKQYENNNNGYRKKESFGDDEDNTSYLDEHQITEEVPMAKITVMAEYFAFGLSDENDDERFKNRFHYQCKGLGINQPQLVEALYDRLPTSWNFQLTHPMRTILQMVFAGDISERIYDHLDYRQLTAAICLAQVKLAERGYVYLPSLCCAQLDKEGTATANSYFQMTADERDYLSEICDVQSKNNEGGSFNEAVVFVKEFFEELEMNQWKSNIEYGILDNPELYNKVKKGELFQIDIDTEIKNEFFQLIKEINS